MLCCFPQALSAHMQKGGSADVASNLGYSRESESNLEIVRDRTLEEKELLMPIQPSLQATSSGMLSQ